MSNKPGAPHTGLAKFSPPFDFVKQSTAIAEMELRKLLRDPPELFSRAVQPT